jgi:hypothetical protein
MTSKNANELVPRVDGTIRKLHYGTGRQPWDDMLSCGWAPDFAAACILRYLRRDKEIEHSIESALWYWARLNELATGGNMRAHNNIKVLRIMLTAAELEGLNALRSA